MLMHITQPDGKGSLRLGYDGVAFLPNDIYPLADKDFRLYYTSESSDQQVIDIYIENNFGQLSVSIMKMWRSKVVILYILNRSEEYFFRPIILITFTITQQNIQ